MLGDGCLTRAKNKFSIPYPTLKILRAIKDIKYLEWEYNIFEKFCLSGIKTRIVYDERYNTNYEYIHFRTRHCEVFDEIYEEWYPAPERKKIVPKNLILSPLICAVWLCDDGSITYGTNQYRLNMQLCTNGFTKNDVEFLVQLLNKRYDEKFRLNIDMKGNPIIRASDSATRAYLKDIDGYMPDAMKRKSDKWRMPEHRFYTNQPGRASCLTENKMGKLSGVEYEILMLIKINERITSKSLLQKTTIKKSNLNYYLQDFEKSGYILIEKRCKSAGGFLYSISENGIDMLVKSEGK
jgi:hypothetical protein